MFEVHRKLIKQINEAQHRQLADVDYVVFKVEDRTSFVIKRPRKLSRNVQHVAVTHQETGNARVGNLHWTEST